MSGIVGIVNLDGAPVDRELLRRMTDSLAFRGPDAQEIWFDGNVGFGHTMLRTTFEAEREHQPCSLDGEVWITADARVDARPELKGELEGAGRHDVKEATDVELILHAYHAWGEDCVKHLLGDFAFAIWDGPNRRLFCARDHFGVRRLYYHRTASGSLLFSNTLNGIRLHAKCSRELDELAVADYLLFGWSQEPESTIFRDIKALPPAHRLVCDKGGLRVGRYWTLPRRPVTYRRETDYVEEFADVFQRAVVDRIRSDRVSVLMSGGLDSPTVAAVASRSSRPGSGRTRVRACTAVYDRIVFEDERRWAAVAAQYLGIPIDYLVADDYGLYEPRDDASSHTPEPHRELWGRSLALLRLAGQSGKVALTGEGADISLSVAVRSPSWVEVRHLPTLLGAVFSYWRRHSRLPGFGVKTALKDRLKPSEDRYALYPAWVSRELTSSLNLKERWRRFSGRLDPATAYDTLSSLFWSQSLLRGYDAGFNGIAVEVRHPFFDVRLVQYLLGVPPVPWLHDKEVLRLFAGGLLPESLRWRPKARVVVDPATHLLRSIDLEVLAPFTIVQTASRFVEHEAFRCSIDAYRAGTQPANGIGRALTFCRWLEYEQEQAPRTRGGEKQDEYRQEHQVA